MDWFDNFPTFLWRSSISNTTWSGWVTVALYYSTALLALILWFEPWYYKGTETRKSYNTRTIGWFHGTLALLLIVLGLARQTGFLRWFTSFGRAIAWEQGWYSSRTLTQQQIIQGMYYGSAVLLVLLVWINRRTILRHGLVLFGVVFLLGFLSVRAVSLHAVDSLLYYRRFAGLRLGTALEVGSLLFIAMALLTPMLFRSLSHNLSHIRQTDINRRA